MSRVFMLSCISDSPYVAFSVAAGSSQDYTHGSVVEFPVIISDVNPGFPGWNPLQNVFICPYTGHYFFMATLLKWTLSDDFHACITSTSLGNIVRSQAWVSSSIKSDITFSSSMSTIAHCEMGESVWVEMLTWSGSLFDGSGNYNQFTGFLIGEDPE